MKLINGKSLKWTCEGDNLNVYVIQEVLLQVNYLYVYIKLILI